jgi:hypothetical protein
VASSRVELGSFGCALAAQADARAGCSDGGLAHGTRAAAGSIDLIAQDARSVWSGILRVTIVVLIEVSAVSPN